MLAVLAVPCRYVLSGRWTGPSQHDRLTRCQQPSEIGWGSAPGTFCPLSIHFCCRDDTPRRSRDGFVGGKKQIETKYWLPENRNRGSVKTGIHRGGQAILKFPGAQARPSRAGGSAPKIAGRAGRPSPSLEILTDLIESCSCASSSPPTQARDNPPPGFPPQLRPPALPLPVTTCQLGIPQPAPAQTLPRRKAPLPLALANHAAIAPSPRRVSSPKDIPRRHGVMADEINEYEGRQPYIHV